MTPDHRMSDAYSSSALNSVVYSARKNWGDFYKSEIWFYENTDTLDHVSSILDIGGGTGGLGSAMSERFGKPFNYTCIDPDPRCIEIGKAEFPQFDFVEGHFPQSLPEGRLFDLVAMQALFPQIPDWKQMLIEMAKVASRYMTFSCNLCLDGPTVVDPDVSYVYYLDSGKRVPQIIHNLYELKNYLAVHEIGAKKISFYGYTLKSTGNNFRRVPLSKQIQGNMLVELFSPEEHASLVRIGAQTGASFENVGAMGFTGPELDFVINGERFTDW